MRNEFSCKAPLRGALVIGANSESDLVARLKSVHQSAEAGSVPESSVPLASDLEAAERIAIDFADAGELASKAGKALKVVQRRPEWGLEVAP